MTTPLSELSSSNSKATVHNFQDSAQLGPSLIENGLKNFHLLVTIGIAIATFWTTDRVNQTKTEVEQANQKLSEVTTTFKTNQEFLKEIKTEINELSAGDSKRARMKLVSLYALTDGDAKKKYILVNLVAASDRGDLIETVASLLEGEYPQGITQEDLNKNSALIAARARLTRKLDLALRQELKNNADGDNTMSISSVGKPNIRADVNLVSQLTPTQAEGWVFLGRQLKGKQIESNVIPDNIKLLEDKNLLQNGGFLKSPEELTIKEETNLRLDRPSNGYTVEQLPTLVSSLRRGSRIKIMALSTVYSANGHIGYWAKVQVLQKV